MSESSQDKGGASDNQLKSQQSNQPSISDKDQEKEKEAGLTAELDEDTPQYIKQYVKDHPGNKMAWYLLGKEYERQGKKGKALYCYQQSQEVYEAFEKKPPPYTEPLPEDEMATVQEDLNGHLGAGNAQTNSSKNNDREAGSNADLKSLHGIGKLQYISSAFGIRIREGWRRSKKIALLVAVLLLFFMSMPQSDTINRSSTDNSQTASIDGSDKQDSDDKGEKQNPAPESNTEQKDWKYRLVWLKDLFVQQERRGALMLPTDSIQQETAWALLPKLDSWYLWGEKMKLYASMRPSEQEGQWLIQYYDEEQCRCDPQDKEELNRQLTEQIALEEKQHVLKSAVMAYQENHGQLPSDLKQLSQDYPNNSVSSFTKEMEEAFAPLLEELADNAATGEPGAQDNMPDGYSPEIMDEPFQILVDVNNHRLALVSGDVIIRNYPVGLGGERTPEGDYVITEKVVNPRGQNKGEFGSRGMTLSDTLYAIHGTNQPSSIGLDQSLGCVRMLEEDLQELYSFVSIGTGVRIGSFDLPEEIVRSAEPFLLPVVQNEENPDKIYRWLN